MKNLHEMSNWQILKESGFLPFLYILIGLFVAILALGIYMGIQDSKNPQEPYHVQVFLYVEKVLLPTPGDVVDDNMDVDPLTGARRGNGHW